MARIAALSIHCPTCSRIGNHSDVQRSEVLRLQLQKQRTEEWDDMGLAVATKAFFKLIFNRELCDSFQQLLDGDLPPKITQAGETISPKPKPPKPVSPRSDAISLLAALQREARLIDIVHEPLANYSDAQVGAAARDVLRDTGKVLDRMFGLAPLNDAEDGTQLETPTSFDPAEFRFIGNVSGEGPFRGLLTHHGWKTTRCEVPQWSGNKSSAHIVAPVEIEIP